MPFTLADSESVLCHSKNTNEPIYKYVINFNTIETSSVQAFFCVKRKLEVLSTISDDSAENSILVESIETTVKNKRLLFLSLPTALVHLRQLHACELLRLSLRNLKLPQSIQSDLFCA